MAIMETIKGLLGGGEEAPTPTIEERLEESSLSPKEMAGIVESSENEKEIEEKIARMEQMKEYSANAIESGEVAAVPDFGDPDAIEVKELSPKEFSDEMSGSNNLNDKGEIDFDPNADYMREAEIAAQAINGENAWEGAHTNGNAEVDSRIERTQTGDGGMGR